MKEKRDYASASAGSQLFQTRRDDELETAAFPAG